MTENLEICRLSLADLSAIVDIEKASYPDPWSLDNIIGELERPITVTLGLKEGSSLQGQCFFWLVPPEIHLLNIAVRPEARGRNLARRLLEAMMYLGSKVGVKLVFLEVRKENFVAIRLYESLGFEKVGLRPAYYDNGEDAVLMNLRLA